LNKRQRRLEGIKRAKRRAMVWHDPVEMLYADEMNYMKIFIKTRVPCSCYMCGNPRKKFGEVTRQEILAEFDELDMLEELEEIDP